LPRRRTDTRAEIRATALDLFIRQGFHKTSLREIAEHLGITKAAVYYHFPSKSELIQDLVRPLLDDLEGLLEGAEAAEAAAPRELLGSYFDAMARHGRVYHALVRDVGTLAELGIMPVLFTSRDRMEELLVGPGAAPADAARATFAVGGVADCAVMQPDAAPDIYRDAVLDAACRALG
jgi:AcrR family transcriptional regulator